MRKRTGGKNVEEFGVCLTSIHTQFNGINGGKNGGRVCWAIQGLYATEMFRFH